MSYLLNHFAFHPDTLPNKLQDLLDNECSEDAYFVSDTAVVDPNRLKVYAIVNERLWLFKRDLEDYDLIILKDYIVKEDRFRPVNVWMLDNIDYNLEIETLSNLWYQYVKDTYIQHRLKTIVKDLEDIQSICPNVAKVITNLENLQ